MGNQSAIVHCFCGTSILHVNHPLFLYPFVSNNVAVTVSFLSHCLSHCFQQVVLNSLPVPFGSLTSVGREHLWFYFSGSTKLRTTIPNLCTMLYFGRNKCRLISQYTFIWPLVPTTF